MFDVDKYFETSSQVINQLKDHRKDIETIAEKIIECSKTYCNIYVRFPFSFVRCGAYHSRDTRFPVLYPVS